MRLLLLQISSEFNRFNESMSEKPRVAIFYGGVPDAEDIKTLKSVSDSPHIVVGTPGRIKAVRLRSTLKNFMHTRYGQSRLFADRLV